VPGIGLCGPHPGTVEPGPGGPGAGPGTISGLREHRAESRSSSATLTAPRQPDGDLQPALHRL